MICRDTASQSQIMLHDEFFQDRTAEYAFQKLVQQEQCFRSGGGPNQTTIIVLEKLLKINCSRAIFPFTTLKNRRCAHKLKNCSVKIESTTAEPEKTKATGIIFSQIRPHSPILSDNPFPVVDPPSPSIRQSISRRGSAFAHTIRRRGSADVMIHESSRRRIHIHRPDHFFQELPSSPLCPTSSKNSPHSRQILRSRNHTINDAQTVTINAPAAD